MAEQELQLQAPIGLHSEILSVQQQVRSTSAKELISILNGPARVQARGFAIDKEHLLAVIVEVDRIDNLLTRFVLYDFDQDELVTSRAYHADELAEAEADADELENVIIKRFDI